MNIELFFLYKTSETWLQQGIKEYASRLSNYLNLEIRIVGGVKSGKNLPLAQQKKVEGESVLKLLEKSDFVVLLDENGKAYTSEGLADFLQERMNSGLKRLIFVVGGPFGFSPELYERADMQLSFSKFTFSHQMIRLLLTEQLYRAMTIIRKESYHHQ